MPSLDAANNLVEYSEEHATSELQKKRKRRTYPHGKIQWNQRLQIIKHYITVDQSFSY